MAGVPYVFASATTSIPLSQLDADFNTPVTIGNTSVGLGNTVTSFGNVTLVNATLTSANVSISGGSANGVVYINSSNVAVASPTVFALDTNGNLGLGVTPETWSLGKAIEVGSNGNSLWGAGSGNVLLGSNFYYNSGYKYAASSVNASYYQQYQGSHLWTIATSGTAGNVVPFITAMTLNTSGTLVFGQSGQGIQFTNSSALTNSTLNDYETGTWTPTQGNAVTVVGAFTSGGTYVKVGQVVTVSARLTGATSITVAGGGINYICNNLPFAIDATGSSYATGSITNNSNAVSQGVFGVTNSVYLNGTSISSSTTIYFTLSYRATF